MAGHAEAQGGKSTQEEKLLLLIQYLRIIAADKMEAALVPRMT